MKRWLAASGRREGSALCVRLHHDLDRIFAPVDKHIERGGEFFKRKRVGDEIRDDELSGADQWDDAARDVGIGAREP